MKLKILLIITTMDQQQLDTIITSDPALKDLTFSIIIIPKTYNEKIKQSFYSSS